MSRGNTVPTADPTLAIFQEMDRNLLWCYTRSAKVSFHTPIAGRYFATVLTLPNGNMYTGYGFNNVVGMARKGEDEKAYSETRRKIEEAKAAKDSEMRVDFTPSVEEAKERKDNEIRVNIKVNGVEEAIKNLEAVLDKAKAVSIESFLAENDFDRLLLTLKKQHDMEVKK